MDYKEKYLNWVNNDYFDDETREELKKIADNEKEIEDRFFKELDFGTGGLRGVIGAGTNRLNIYTISKATQGLANYILKEGEEAKNAGVCIAYDSRRFSTLFAKTAALVLNGNGIKTYLFETLRPTPTLSFAIRELNAAAGIVVTASHNPPEYNGYKVYWSDGGQVPFPRDNEIITEVNAITDFSMVKKLTEEEATQQNLFNIIGKEIDDKYVKKVKEQLVNKELVTQSGKDLNIVYTPLHGTGNILVRRVLDEVGFKNVFVVPEQELPDENFSTVGYPNPEDPNVFKLGIALGEEHNADLILATDPDCDRIGVVIKNDASESIVLTGNMVGVLITDYLIKQNKSNNTMPKNPAIISTIVSTDMTKAIAEKNNITYIDVLTGFKYIGEKIKEFEISGSNNFLFGFEESYGALAGTYARDKDAVVIAMLVCEMALYYKAKGMNLYDGLQQLYKEYGFFKESIETITLKGIDGLNDMKKIMTSLRENPPKSIDGTKIISLKDYSIGKEINFVVNATKNFDMPKSDVLYFDLGEGSWFCVRPSGTEPKVKIYFGIKGENNADADSKLKSFSESVMKLIQI